MTNFLITGGAGFIGHHLAKYLLGMDEKVTIYDSFSDYYSPYLKWRNARDVEDLGGTIVEGNILSKKQLVKAIHKNKIETVIHLAAQPGVRYSTENPEMALRINVEGTSNVLSVSRENDVRKAVITSSSSVFGATQYMPMDEEHSTEPISFYGVSKLTSEKLVTVCNHLYPEFDTTILRPFTVVGARQRPDMAINIFISRVLNRETINIFGNGNQTRDWTHVGNIVQAFHLAATMPKAKHQIFNVGAGTRISVNEVLAIVAEVTDIEPILEYSEMNKADVKDTFADIGKAKRLLGYHPKKTIYDAVEDFTQYWEDVNYGKLLASEKLIEREFSSAEIFSP